MVQHALAFGVSQAGRFLRHFLELGMNDDGHSRRVFDGVMSHVAGAGKVFANHRFGMPRRTATQHEDRLYPENWFPFGNAVTTDPFSRKTGAILRGHPSDPLVIETNSSTEYWQKGASLVHTDPSGRNDAELPPHVRVYLVAGTQHGGRPGVDPSPGPCVNPRNPHSATPALRALFAALEEWVTKGTSPPPSRVPRIADGTAVMAESIKLPAVAGFAHAPGANPIVPPVDWTDPPGRIDNVYGVQVCALIQTATRSPASGCRRSQCRSAPTPDGMFTGRNPASSPTATARLSLLPGRGRSARRFVTRAHHSRSAMAPVRPMSPRSGRRPRRSSPNACSYFPTPRNMSKRRRNASGSKRQNDDIGVFDKIVAVRLTPLLWRPR